MSTQNLRVSQWLPTTTPLANEGVVVEDDGDGTEFAPINIPGPMGPAGPIGPQGAPGVGTPGETGPANELTVDSVVTGAPGAPAEVTIAGTPPSQTISFVIPRGQTGPANSLTVDTVTTGAPGTPADVTISGTPPNQTISFVIPRGEQGEPGEPGSGGGVTDHGALTGLSDDDHPQYMLKDEQSGPSIVSGGIVTSNPDGTVNVSSGSGFLRTANDPNAPVVDVTWPAVANQAIAETVPTYVYIEYSGGTTSVALSTVYSNRYDRSLVAGVSRSGTSVYITQGSVPAGNVSRQVSRYLFNARGIDRVSGLITSETGTRNIVNTAGTVFSGLNEFALAAKNTATGDTFTTSYRNGSGGWTAVAGQTQWNNLQYDNGSGALATISNGRYGVHWVCRDVNGGLHLLYGQGEYTLAQAQAAGLPATRPPNLQYWHAVFCAKIIFARSAATATQIDIAFTTNIGAGSVSDHGALAGLSDDDHPQYLTQARGDALYAPIGGGGGGTPAGANTQIQYNASGAFGASAGLTWDDSTRTFRLAATGATFTLVNATSGNGGPLTVKAGTAFGSGSGGALNLRGGDPLNGTGGAVDIRAANAVGNTNIGGDVLMFAGNGLTSGNGGAVSINGGDSPSGSAGWITLSAGAGSTAANSGTFRVQTFGTTRFAITGAGVWQVGGSAGTSGQVLTSQGAASPPIWAAASGGGGTPGGATTNIQFNNAGAFGGEADFTWDSSSNILGVGSSAVPGVIRGGDGTAGGLTVRAGNATTGSSAALTLQGGATSVASGAGGNVVITGGAPGANGVPGSINMTIVVTGNATPGSINLTSGRANAAGGAINITGGTSSNPAGTGGAVNIQGGFTSGSSTGGAVVIKGGGYSVDFGVQSGSTGGLVTIAGGDMLALGNGTGGNVVIRGGQVTGGYTGPSGHVTVQGGDGLSANAGGNLTLRGGTSASGTAGYVNFQTGATTERFRILANGAWSIGAAGTDTGTAGQVLTSNGNGGPPTWQTPASDARLKDDIADLDLGLEFVRQLRPVSFAWIHDETKMPHFGLIAQDVLKVLAGRECGMVDTSGERYGMTYTELIPILIRAIQQLAQLLPQQEAA